MIERVESVFRLSPGCQCLFLIAALHGNGNIEILIYEGIPGSSLFPRGQVLECFNVNCHKFEFIESVDRLLGQIPPHALKKWHTIKMLLALLLSMISADATPSASVNPSGLLHLSDTAWIIICVVIIVGGGLVLFFLVRYFCWNRFQRENRNEPGLLDRTW
jgi:hypothetical protein